MAKAKPHKLRKPTRKRPVTCPKLTWTVKAGGSVVDVKAFVGDRRVAVGTMWLNEPGSRRFPTVAQVSYTRVANDLQRCGIGTQLYERLAKIACARGFNMASDTSRSRYSEGFWRKQRTKGRAQCLHARGTLEARSHWPEEPPDVSVPAESPCDQYVLKTACPTSLARVRKRRKK
jgi:hypothetical protein